MHKLRIEAGVVLFLLLFGTALVDALRHHTWLLTSVYLLLAASFVFVAWSRHERNQQGVR